MREDHTEDRRRLKRYLLHRLQSEAQRGTTFIVVRGRIVAPDLGLTTHEFAAHIKILQDLDPDLTITKYTYAKSTGFRVELRDRNP